MNNIYVLEDGKLANLRCHNQGWISKTGGEAPRKFFVSSCRILLKLVRYVVQAGYTVNRHKYKLARGGERRSE